MALKIIIETIPHGKQRYPTCGDWWWGADGTTHIAVSDMGDWKKEALVAVHELCEVLMCRADGISQIEVDDFDMRFEANRPKGNVDEPGDEAAAPYAKQHCVATGIERVLCAALGVSWGEYEKLVESL